MPQRPGNTPFNRKKHTLTHGSVVFIGLFYSKAKISMFHVKHLFSTLRRHFFLTFALIRTIWSCFSSNLKPFWGFCVILAGFRWDFGILNLFFSPNKHLWTPCSTVFLKSDDSSSKSIFPSKVSRETFDELHAKPKKTTEIQILI